MTMPSLRSLACGAAVAAGLSGQAIAASPPTAATAKAKAGPAPAAGPALAGTVPAGTMPAGTVSAAASLPARAGTGVSANLMA